ncbi:MAG: intradiol ring-cleavage dioxygenase [Alphaproteobacteria bacterium]|nr:intradiol ring-cleavage dioxygenase [Alphaproteobacteria bacterium]
MRNLNQHNITEAVLASFANTPDPRLKEIISSLIKHLHNFARDVKLTEDEWFKGIQYLTATGHKCTGTRQEFILLSDVLGLSMLTIAMNQDKPAGCTEATVFGPFFLEEAPKFELGSDVSNGAKGAPCWVEGRILGLDGEPIPNATINVWQADDDGLYDVQYEDLGHSQARGILKSNSEGRYYFRTIVAEPYPIPTDGPVGVLLNATKRHPWRPAHLHFMVEAPGYQRLITHVFRDKDGYLDSDAVFGVRQSLIADWVLQADGTYRMDYDFILPKIGVK